MKLKEENDYLKRQLENYKELERTCNELKDRLFPNTFLLYFKEMMRCLVKIKTEKEEYENN